MMLFNIYICSELSYNLDNYVSVHNNINKSTLLFLVSLNNYKWLSDQRLQNRKSSSSPLFKKQSNSNANLINKENDEFKILMKIQELIDNNEFLYSLANRTDYKLIMNILNNDKLNLKQKQNEIENVYFTTLEMNQLSSIQNNKFFNSGKGLWKRKNTEEDLNTYKNTPRFWKNKKYHFIVSALESSVIISNIISIVITFIFKYQNIYDQNFQRFLIKVGKSLTKIYIKIEFANYLNLYNKIYRQ